MENSKYFTKKELLFSATAVAEGIPNTPSLEVWDTLNLCALRMDKVREALGTPIHVNSWFRCLALNRRLGSKDTSQHLKGEAVDFTAIKFGTPLQIVQFLSTKMEELEIDQLILEHTWVHISFAISPRRLPRRNILTLLNTGEYAKGITDKQGNKIK